MQMAEPISLTFTQARVIDNKGNHKHPVGVPVNVTHSYHNYVPMELGAAATFHGKCHLCGRFGHKAS